MSKVKIEGHGTGTGTFTVTTPSSNTDRTITLPDSTGTLATTADVPSSITDNGDATAITIGSDEKVRIGNNTTFENGFNDLCVGSVSGQHGITIATQNNTVATLAFADNNSSYGGYLQYNHSEDSLKVFTGSGTATVRARIDSDGLKFNADTAAANALDDYEEGTFTLAMYSGQSGTITNTTANYTKIGRNVTLNFFGNINNATGNSFVRISGFPFSLPNIGIQVTAYYNQRQVIGLYFSSGGYFYYQNTVVGGNNAGQDTSWLDASTGIAFNVTYII